MGVGAAVGTGPDRRSEFSGTRLSERKNTTGFYILVSVIHILEGDKEARGDKDRCKHRYWERDEVRAAEAVSCLRWGVSTLPRGSWASRVEQSTS